MKTSFVRSGSRSAVFLLCFLLYSSRFLAQSASCSLSGNQTVCVGDIVSYALEIEGLNEYSVEWRLSDPNGTILIEDKEHVVIQWKTPGIVTLTPKITPNELLIGAFGCSYSVEIFAKPDPMIMPEYLPSGDCTIKGRSELSVEGYCLGSTIRFLPSGGNGTFSWRLNGNNTYEVQNDGSVLVTMTTPGPFEICLKETNATVSHCEREVCNSYSVYEPPSVEISELSHGSATAISVCKGENLLFNGEYMHPNDFNIGLWSWRVLNAADQVVATGSSKMFNYTFQTSGTYRVQLYATNCLGCASEVKTVTVTVSNTDRPVIVCPSVVCQSDMEISYCTPAICSTYQWTVSGGTISGSSTASCVKVIWKSPLPDGYGWVTLQPQDCEGEVCTEPTTVEVPVIPEVQPITGATSLCSSNFLVQENYSVPYWPGALYTWSYEIVENLSGGNITILSPDENSNTKTFSLFNFYGSFKVKVSIQHPVANCSSRGSLSVSSYNYEVVQTDETCPKEDVQLHIEPTPSGSYSIEWSITGGAFTEKIENSPDVTIPGNNFPEGGNYSVTALLNFEDGETFSCGALNYQVTVKPTPEGVLEIEGPHQICPNVPYVYSANPPAPGSLTWTVTGGNPQMVTGTSIPITWLEGGVPYSISVVRVVNGCVSLPFVLENIEPFMEEEIFISGPDKVCHDGTGIYTASMDGATNYVWVVESPPGAGTIIAGQGTPQVTIQWHQGYSSAMVVLKASVCNAEITATKDVSLVSNTLSIICPNISSGCRICANSDITFTTDNSSGVSYEWFLDDDLQEGQNANSFTTSIAQPGTHFVRVRMMGTPECPGTLEDVLSIDVIPNPAPILTIDKRLFCETPEPLNIYSTTYQGADNELFEWHWSKENDQVPSIFGPPIFTYSSTSPVLMINGSSFEDHYAGIFSVIASRTIDGQTCTAASSIQIPCDGDMEGPGTSSAIEFTNWSFELGQPCTNCRSATPNACGYVTVNGKLIDRSFDEVQDAEWQVSDPNEGLTDPDNYPIIDPIGLQATTISVFSKAGYYPTALRVHFGDEVTSQFDFRTIQIPIQPGFSWRYDCGGNLGFYNLELMDISERVPGVAISKRDWDVTVLGEATETTTTTDATLTKSVLPGSAVKVCITPYARTNGNDNPDMEYFCTHCDTIYLPNLPELYITADRSTACAGALIQFGITNIIPGQIVSYRWDFGDGSSSALSNPTKAYTAKGDYNVILEVVTNTGCIVTTAAYTITVLAPTDIRGYVSVSYDNCHSEATISFVDESSSVTGYLWNTGETESAISTMQGGVYTVTVSDTKGCTFKASEMAEIIQPFFSEIKGEPIICKNQSTTFSFDYNPQFSYVWTSDLHITIGNSESEAEVFGDIGGTHTISVTAMLGNEACMTITKEVMVPDAPSPPVLEVDYTCEPFTAHVSTDPSQNVVWSYNSNTFIGYSPDIYTSTGGSYLATVTDELGCTASEDIVVLGPPGAQMLSGCYEICDTVLKDGTICLPIPTGTYTEWAWLLNGTEIRSGHNSPVEKLCLDKTMEGEIILTLTREYQNDNLPSTTLCEWQSDPFCLNVLECGEQPCFDHPLAVYYSYSNFQCVLGSDLFYERVAGVDNLRIIIPPGYRYCGDFEINGAYLSNPPVVVGNTIYINGYLHITDHVAYQQGLQGSLTLCNIATGDECPAVFQLPDDECVEPIWCMLMGGPVLQYADGFGDNVQIIIQFPLHFITGPTCNITQYTVELTDDNYVPIYDTTYTANPPSLPAHAIDMLATLTYTMSKKDWNNRAWDDCRLILNISSNCGNLSCNTLPFCLPNTIGTYPGTGGGRSSNYVPELISSLDLVPNPASNLLTIKYGTTEGQTNGETGIEITNVLGQTVFRQFDSSAQGNLQVDVSDWQAGVYLVNLVAGDKKIAVKKLVKQ